MYLIPIIFSYSFNSYSQKISNLYVNKKYILQTIKKEEDTNFNEYWDSRDFKNNALLDFVEIHEADKI